VGSIPTRSRHFSQSASYLAFFINKEVFILNIAGISLPNRVILAPMAGVTDLVTRRFAKEMGVALTITEMVNDMGLIHAHHQTLSLARLDESGLRSLQLFGSRPETMAQAATIASDLAPDLIDINMGCPTRKIVSGGGGAALMLNTERAVAIVRAVTSKVRIPVTVKFRSGWDNSCLNAPDFAEALEGAGAAALTIHARTREQFYGGKADWTMIRLVKERVRIPVIGNGDIWTAEDAVNMLRVSGCDAVMIGRGAMGNPWLLQRVIQLLEHGVLPELPTPDDRILQAVRHLQAAVALKGEYIAVREMRKHCAWYLKTLPRASQVRVKMNNTSSAREMIIILETYAQSLSCTSCNE